MYWTVVSIVATILLLMLGVSAVCLAREFRHCRSLSDIMRAVLADEER